jgi:hypothetical protein
MSRRAGRNNDFNKHAHYELETFTISQLHLHQDTELYTITICTVERYYLEMCHKVLSEMVDTATPTRRTSHCRLLQSFSTAIRKYFPIQTPTGYHVRLAFTCI